MSVLAGIDAKVYLLSTGTRATWGTPANGVHKGAAPTNLAELDAIRNVDLNADDSEGDASVRRTKWKLSIPTQTDAGLSFDIPWDPSDANFVKLRDAKFGRTPVALAVLDGDKTTAGSQGLWADFAVFGWQKTEPIDKEQMVKVTLKPTPSAVDPEWVEVASGT